MVVGCGTGRCGTSSLAALLRLNGLDATHERFSSDLPYKGGGRWADKLIDSGRPDVALQWIWYAERLIRGGAVMICLRRDRDETTRSYMEKTGTYNHWQQGGEANRWDWCYPTYDAPSKQSAINKYWHHYYKLAGWLEHQYASFRVFGIESLNSAHGQREILSFAGVEQQVVKPGIRLNAA